MLLCNATQAQAVLLEYALSKACHTFLDFRLKDCSTFRCVAKGSNVILSRHTFYFKQDGLICDYSSSLSHILLHSLRSAVTSSNVKTSRQEIVASVECSIKFLVLSMCLLLWFKNKIIQWLNTLYVPDISNELLSKTLPWTNHLTKKLSQLKNIQK